MVEVERDSWRSHGPPPLLKKSYLDWLPRAMSRWFLNVCKDEDSIITQSFNANIQCTQDTTVSKRKKTLQNILRSWLVSGHQPSITRSFFFPNCNKAYCTNPKMPYSWQKARWNLKAKTKMTFMILLPNLWLSFSIFRVWANIWLTFFILKNNPVFFHEVLFY